MTTIELPKSLTSLDPDTLQWAIELAVEIILRDVAPIRGLSNGESRLVRAVHAARGRTVKQVELQEVCAHDLGELSSAGHVRTLLCYIGRKRPDIHAMLETVHAVGIRWRDPKVSLEVLG